ncbi:MAG: J domain-containing protein, partial [Actinomycetota bacterium]|nr:J domain-containing protein [Actinomycetota bacterium]
MDPFATLGLGASATPEEIAAAYRASAKRWHPDRAGNGGEAARRMAEVNAAHDLLRGRGHPTPAGSGAATSATGPTPAGAPKRSGHWLAESVRRSLGRELLTALQEDEAVELVTPAATWKSPRAVLVVTDRRLLGLLDDAISHRVHALKWRDVVRVEH